MLSATQFGSDIAFVMPGTMSFISFAHFSLTICASFVFYDIIRHNEMILMSNATKYAVHLNYNEMSPILPQFSNSIDCDLLLEFAIDLS